MHDPPGGGRPSSTRSPALADAPLAGVDTPTPTNPAPMTTRSGRRPSPMPSPVSTDPRPADVATSTNPARMTIPSDRWPSSMRSPVPTDTPPAGVATPAPTSPALPAAQRWALCVFVAMGGLFGAVGLFGGHGWVWPVLFLVGAVAVGVRVGRQPWLVVGLVVSSGALLAAPGEAVRYLAVVWMWVAALVGAAAVVGSVRRCVPDGLTLLGRLALLLPPAEREHWRAEVCSVPHACASQAEARRQVVGFLTAVPVTVVASWRYLR
jgi:hypothetical protein